ncbi:MAG: low molecular weight phosphatase family protein [Actinomycetota bacterium]|nr:low molecular weight phosphatase family protein [Actinomycetota bacterium]
MVKRKARGWATYNRRIDVLLLCTANQCRSPMAQVLLGHHLRLAGVDATVSSAGLYPSGAPATDHAVTVMGERGLDLTAHESRRVDASIIGRADLVLGMTREHVREVAVADPAVLARTFTLKELVRAAETSGGRRPNESFEAFLQRMGVGRRRDTLLGVGHDDAYDVEDPVGRSLHEYERTADELDDLLGRLVALLWPGHAAERSA